jgi:hypothetical protein
MNTFGYMNRRDFCRRLAVSAAGGIALLEPTKTFFLAPPGGWWQPTLYMREIEYAVIDTAVKTGNATDSIAIALRWDAAWLDGRGIRHGYQILGPTRDADVYPACIDAEREGARAAFEKLRRTQGFGDSIDLPLPYRGVTAARRLSYG